MPQVSISWGGRPSKPKSTPLIGLRTPRKSRPLRTQVSQGILGSDSTRKQLVPQRPRCRFHGVPDPSGLGPPWAAGLLVEGLGLLQDPVG